MTLETTPEQAQRLHRLGIPLPAARVYIALAELGESEAREIARAASIPISKVYPAIEQLQSRGLASVVLDSPRRYAPRPIEDFFREVRRAREEELRALDAERDELQALFCVQPAAKLDDRGSFSMIRGRRSTFKKMEQLLARARQDVLVLSSRSLPLASPAARAWLDDAARRGVRVRILARAQPSHGWSGIEVRETSSGPDAEHVLTLVCDSESAIAVHILPDDSSPRQGHDMGLSTTQRAIVAALRELIETRWEHANATSASSAYAPIATPARE